MKFKKSLILFLFICLLTVTSFAAVNAADASTAKNIIFMIPDGMSMDIVTAARILKNGPDGEPLALEKLNNVGYIRTYSADSIVTDSAAASSAMATGEKHNNREVSAHSVNGELMDIEKKSKTILEIAEDLNKSTGLVATSQISHATPATFGAHVPVRYAGAEIARQYIEETEVDVVLGGGVYGTSDEYNAQQFEKSYNNLQSNEAVANLARENGYLTVNNESEMRLAQNKESDRIFGMFTAYDEGKTPELFRLNKFGLKDSEGNAFPKYPEGEPTLAEMTETALKTLENDSDGFFLMVEGSQIDWGGHDNDLNYELAEMLGFDKAVETVLNWLEQSPLRKSETLVIIAPDHDTGGLRIAGPYGSLSSQSEKIESGWTSEDHTGGDVPTWSQGPGSELIAQPLDNTDIFKIMKKVMR
jgi:alkaline phosphatase